MNNVPQKAGLYWAKWIKELSPSDKKYTIIVNVTGYAPFLKARAWDLEHDEHFVVSDAQITIEWGPEIVVPEPILHREK